ncbi:hypothetical protein V2J09_003922 [Rumex salicifolius]
MSSAEFAMDCLTCSTRFHPLPFHASFLRTLSRINSRPPLKPSYSNLRSITDVNTWAASAITEPVEQCEERPKFRWVEIRPTLEQVSEEQRIAISQLPKKMTKRCKAFMRQIICYSPQKGNLLDLVAFWVRVMKPIRADWLAVLKQLSDVDHPLFLQVFDYALSEESFEPNVRDYTKMIHLYAKQNRLQDAENTFSSMTQRGMVCDQVTLTTMIHMYSKAGNFEKAKEIFDEMKLLGQPLDKRSYGSMIMACIRAGFPNQGEALVLEMEGEEVYAGREVYKALLRAYSMNGDCEGAQRVFDAIQLSGTFPDVKQCALLINAYMVAGQSRKALRAFENIRMAGVEPNDKCVALLLAGYEKENNLSSALDLLTNLEKDGIMVGKEAAELLAGWFRRIGVAEEVALILREYA